MYEFIRINDVLIISSAFSRMIRDDLKYTDVKSLFKLLCLMADKKTPMYSCDFVNSKNNIFRIKAKRISTFLKNIAQDTFRNVIHVSREAGGMSDFRTKRYEYSLYITNECHHITLEIKGTNIFISHV
jgi:hypothetical protein